MAKVDILNYISDDNILRSTYDTDTNELDITDVPQNLNSVITLGQGGGGGGLQYGSPLKLISGGLNYFDDALWLDVSGAASTTRLSLSGNEGEAVVTNFPGTTALHVPLPEVKLIKIEPGSTKVKILCDFTCQVSIKCYTVTGTTGVMNDDSGWVNITADTWLSYNIPVADEISITFRKDASNSYWTATNSSNSNPYDARNNIYSVQVEFE